MVPAIVRNAARNQSESLPAIVGTRIDGFFEWQAMTGGKQPYAIAMKGRIMGELEKRYHPRMGSGLHDPVPSNDLVSRIHDRMPAIVDRRHYDRWLGREADPHDLLVTYS